MFCPNKCGSVCLLPTEGQKKNHRISTDTDFTTGDTFACCSKCKSAVKDTDAVIDAVRIGQEALDKAEALQIASEIF